MLILLAGCLSPPAVATPGPKAGPELREVTVGARSAWLHVPRNLPQGTPVPLVLMFHGGHGSGLDVTGFWKETFDQKVILAFPNGQQETEFSGWNPASGDVREHVRFVEALLDQLVATYPIDPSRIYAAGFSDGGQMTLRLACLSDRFAGFAVVSQTMKADTLAACRPARPVPMLFVMGTDDPKNPEGGRAGSGPEGQARLGTRASLDWWLTANRCANEPVTSRLLPDRSPDGMRVTERVYGCTGAPVRYLEIAGGGHAWPVTHAKPGAGGRCTDISGADEAMRFWQILE